MIPCWHEIRIGGVVQGVGFRPMVYRVAVSLGMRGHVFNGPDGVIVRVHATQQQVDRFAQQIRLEKPDVARIDELTVRVSEDQSPPVPSSFYIARSETGNSGASTDVSPDIAICPQCLADMEQQPRRRDYALTNCTKCGPRFTITARLPYDRPSTTMDEFEMCGECRAEYTDPADRRFHAQPIACRNCGPVYTMEGECDMSAIVSRCSEILTNGKLLMVKSLGGYNIIADARNDHAISQLRQLKHRPRKPFAIMVRDPRQAEVYAQISQPEMDALTSWRAPIVIVKRSRVPLALNLAPRLNTIGIMLPYMGFQHLLMRSIDFPIAVTSANFPGSPIIADDAEAADYARVHGLPLVMFNRRIHNRVDDSVVRVIDGSPRILRRGRGYAPDPLQTDLFLDSLMAMGADVTGGWAFGRRNDAIASQYIGSLAAGEGAEMFLRETVRNLTDLYRITPRVIGVDAHPGYVSSKIGREIAAASGCPVMEIWHHHAHAAAVMAEYGLKNEVLALVLDGTGAGPDGTVWGSELLRCSLTGFQRLDHGLYLPMPGGDLAAAQPWRMAVALWHALGKNPDSLPEALVNHVGRDKIAFGLNMIDRGINSPQSCGAGRLWDAVAALEGLCYENSYEAEAPVLLEGSDSALSEEFHTRYSSLWIRRVTEASAATGLKQIVLTGGVMQNARFAGLLCAGLRNAGLQIFMPRLNPPGDGSIAVGQLAIMAASRRTM